MTMADDEPREPSEDNASFQALDRDDVPGPGPRAVLLCGLPTTLQPALTEILTASDAKDHRVVFCTRDLVASTLGEALAAAPPLADALPPSALPPVVVLSGMTGAQIHGVIDRWRAAGLPAPIWASTTPTNLDFSLRALLRDLLAEQRAMARARQE